MVRGLGWRGWIRNSNANIFPEHPVGIEGLCAEFRVEAAGDEVFWLDVDAYAQSLLFDEPRGQSDDHLPGDPVASVGLDYVDPFQLALAAVPRGAMSGDE